MTNIHSPKELDKMVRNYTQLVGAIYYKYGSKSKFADKMRVSRPTLDKKLSGESQWTQAEISRACELLDIEKNKIPDYFFAD